MKKIFIFGIVIFITVISIIFIQKSAAKAKTKTITIVNHRFTVETADTDEKRSQGLSNRDRLGQNEGMLFIFPTPSYYKFWMKDMKFPLDFIWIDKDTIIDLSENVLAPKSTDEKLTTFTAKYPFDRVIEVNAGVIKSLNIKIGDRVLL